MLRQAQHDLFFGGGLFADDEDDAGDGGTGAEVALEFDRLGEEEAGEDQGQRSGRGQGDEGVEGGQVSA